MRRLTAIVFASTLLACSDDPGGPVEICKEMHKTIPVQLNRSLDILLVVDSSPSFADQREALPTHLERWVNVLENIEGGLPDLRIGVVSSDVSNRDGALESSPQVESCATPDDAFIEVAVFQNGETEPNFPGSLSQALACIAMLPSDGGRVEEPLEAMRRALEGGFRRDSAFLLVLFVGDEDDCSGGRALVSDSSEARTAWECLRDAVECEGDLEQPGDVAGCEVVTEPETLTPLAEYEEYVRQGGDEGTTIVTSVHAPGPIRIAAEGEPELASTCGIGQPDAYPAPRLADFIQRFPFRNAEADICSDDWTDVLIPIAQSSASTTIGSPCLEGKIDLEPDLPGLQADCVVTRTTRASGEERLLPECPPDPTSADTPCWRTFEDEFCETETGYAFEIVPGRERYEPGGATVELRCSIACYEVEPEG